LLDGGHIDRGSTAKPTIPAAGSSIPKAKLPKPGIGGAAPAGA
jgi:cell division protease FtsH